VSVSVSASVSGSEAHQVVLQPVGQGLREAGGGEQVVVRLIGEELAEEDGCQVLPAALEGGDGLQGGGIWALQAP
jgi:hypothetical protein